jgi:hypothetical protein
MDWKDGEIRDAIARLCADLRLPSGGAYTQDWAYELPEQYRGAADLERYVDAYASGSYTEGEREVLLDLILDVTNDLLGSDRPVAAAAWDRVVSNLTAQGPAHRELLEYWACVGSELEDAFAVTPLVRGFLSQVWGIEVGTTTGDYLHRVESPWIYLGAGERERKSWIPSHFYARDERSLCVRKLRGQKMRDKAALMNEFGAALQFFDGFGENWHALGDCLRSLDEWLPGDGYVLVVENADVLLRDEPAEMVWLLKVLHEVGAFWAKPIADGDRFDRPARPFHVLLHLAEDVFATDTNIARAARDAGIPLRY